MERVSAARSFIFRLLISIPPHFVFSRSVYSQFHCPWSVLRVCVLWWADVVSTIDSFFAPVLWKLNFRASKKPFIKNFHLLSRCHNTHSHTARTHQHTHIIQSNHCIKFILTPKAHRRRSLYGHKTISSFCCEYFIWVCALLCAVRALVVLSVSLLISVLFSIHLADGDGNGYNRNPMECINVEWNEMGPAHSSHRKCSEKKKGGEWRGWVGGW